MNNPTKYLPDEAVIDGQAYSAYLLGIRKERDFSVVEMADDWGVSPNTIYMWEHCKCNPKFNLVVEMLNAYGFDVIIKRREQK